MSKRTPANWQSTPGSFDALHLNIDRFPASNRWGIPQLLAASPRHLPQTLVPYRYRARPSNPLPHPATHFFLDDYRFESAWRSPTKATQFVSKYGTVLTPDFSLFRDWPLAAQLWNVYRNRWMGAYWQAQGLRVIPTVSWSSAESYDFCFLGVTRGSVVALSAVGVPWRHDLLAHTLFMNGFRTMIELLEPAAVIAYGKLPPACSELAELIVHPTRWESGRRVVV